MDPRLVLLAGALHLLMLLLAGVLLVGRGACEATHRGRNATDRTTAMTAAVIAWSDGPSRPRGGIPIRCPTRARAGAVREPGRLADMLPRRERRPLREPERTPVRL